MRRGCQAATRGQTCPAQGEKNGRHAFTRCGTERRACNETDSLSDSDDVDQSGDDDDY